MPNIHQIVKKLHDCDMHFILESTRNDSIRILIAAPGKRIEIDCFEDLHVEYSVFSGDESVGKDFDEMFSKMLAA